MSLRASILALIAAALLVPATAFVALLAAERQQLVADAHGELSDLANSIAQRLDERVLGTGRLLYGLSRARDLTGANRAACSTFLSGVLREFPQYTGLVTILPNGNLHCDSLRTERDLDLSDRAYFRSALKAHGPVIEPAFGRLTGKAVLQVAYPARDAEGNLLSILLASFDLEKFARAEVQARRHSRLVVVLWTRAGQVLAHLPESGAAGFAGRTFPGARIARFALEASDGDTAEFAGLDGIERVWARASLPGGDVLGGLHVTVGESKAKLLMVADQRLNDGLMLAAGAALLMLAVAWIVGERAIHAPLERVAAAVTRFGQGDLAARIGGPYPRDGIGRLMRIVDRMAERVQSQRRELEGLNATLDRRVAERTGELERANQELEALSHSISHGLRAPLRHVEGFLDLLLRSTQDQLSPQAQGHGREIAAAAGEMGERIEALLRYLRAGREMVVTTVDTRALVHECIREAELAESGRRIEWSVGPPLPVRGDPGLLREVFAGLIANAIKFSRPRDPAHIEVGCVGRDGERLVFCVRDDGVGFEMEQARALFAIFERLDHEDAFEGLGVGLATARRIVHRHGGRIWAESTHGRGAAFFFTLTPADPDAERDREPSP